MCTGVLVDVKASGHWWVSSSGALHLTFEVGSLLNLELTICLDWLASESLDPPVSTTTVRGLQCELWCLGLTGVLGPHTCVISLYQLSPIPSPRILFLVDLKSHQREKEKPCSKKGKKKSH